MIFRKPYAFFIKYFRVINLVMASLMAILIYQTIVIGKFLNDYIADYDVGNNFVLSNYINFYSFLLCLVIIVLIIVVTSVMFIKKKPMKLYIFNLVVAVLLIILYIIDYNVMKNIGDGVLDVRVSKAIRDITFIALGIQSVSFIVTLIRATGFDLKNFEFSRDLKELEIDVKDNEEFEVAVELDKNKVKRGFRNKFRLLKYFYVEHKFIINIIVVSTLVVIVFIVVIITSMYSSNYGEGRIFTASGVQFNVTNSYITDSDQSGNLIVPDGNQLVVVRIDVRKLSLDRKTTLNTGLITLKAGDSYYGKTTLYSGYLDDIGTSYIDQKLEDDFTSYILTFEVPQEKIEKGMHLKINDNVSYIRGEVGAKNIFIKLKPVDLTESHDSKVYKIGDTISFSDSLLGESILKITKSEVANRFKSEYQFCSKKDKCYKSYEYIIPTATGSYFKTLLKIEGEFELDENTNLSGIDDIYYLLNRYASIKYNGHESTISSQRVRPKVASDDAYYIEINRDALNCQNLSLVFKVRNYSYEYVLK